MTSRRGLFGAALLTGLAMAACVSDEVTFAGPGATGVAGQGGQGAASGGSTGRGGGGSGAAGGADDGAWFVVPNVDDDDGSGTVDWSEGPFDADNEIEAQSLPEALLGALAPGDRLLLSVEGSVDAFRIWHGGSVLLGHVDAAETITEAELGDSDAAEPLLVEAETFHRRVALHIEHRNAADEQLGTFEATITSSPLVLNHHVQSAERIWGVVTGTNQAMVQAIADAAGARWSPIYSYDPWIQDELEWATATRDGHRLDVAVDSIRDRELDAWVKALEAPDVQPITWGSGPATTEDKFGNLETAPPHTAGGVSYPFGRIYYGANAEVGPTQALTDVLAEQQLQAPIEVDTGWLCVGHVDEFMTFVPDPSSPKGFKLLYADVNEAYALLDSLPPSTALPRYGSTHGYATVGAMTGDGSLRALNGDVQADYLTPILDGLRSALELDETDVIRVPALFERISGCPYSSDFMEVAALIPALVNLTVLNPAGEPVTLFVPDPFLRAEVTSPSSDPLIAAFTAAMPVGTNVVFVDDWFTYHVLLGEVHCGTNVSRTPSPRWWVEGLGLLGGD